MKKTKVLSALLIVVFVLGGVMTASAGMLTPGKYWFSNRLADFMDIFNLGVGVTCANPKTGWFPPTAGVYVEATSLFNLGYITHNGVAAEWDGRGLGAYDESRKLHGIGLWRWWEINQGAQVANYYKDPERSAKWKKRMETEPPEGIAGHYMDGTTVPANEGIHDDTKLQSHIFGKRSGWQRSMYIGAEIAIPEPFVTHHGVTVRAGFDLSQAVDFVFGLFGYDFLQDDRQNDE